MTVSELITELKKYEPTLSIKLDTNEQGPEDLDNVSKKTVKGYDNKDYTFVLLEY